MEELAASELRTEHTVLLGDRHVSVPGFRLGEHVVWGLTYRVITALIERTARVAAKAELT
jgi:hypothetical protein